MSSSRSLLSIVVLAFVALLSQAQSTKDVAIDDTDKAWAYFPESSWGAISDKNPCTACNTQPDPEKVHGKTWHDLSKGGSAQLSFVGSGVVVYAVCPKGVYRLNVTFLVDNEPAGHFMAPEGGCKDYTYNQVIYRKSGLPVAPHIFQVNNWIAPGDEYSTSDLVIDYAVVTPGDSTEGGDSPTTSQSTTKTTTSVQPPASTPQPGSTETIDDVNASWSYNGPWGQISAASPCPACQTQPDATKAHGTTWHDLSQAGSASLSFTGTGVKVYTICPGPLANGGAFSSRFAFFLDGKEAGTHVGEPTGCKEYVYDELVYEVSGLSSGSHNFTIQNVIAENGNTSDLILDYAVVEGSTSGTPSPSPSGTSQPTFPSLGPGPIETNAPEDAGSRTSVTGIVGVLMASLVVALGL